LKFHPNTANEPELHLHPIKGRPVIIMQRANYGHNVEKTIFKSNDHSPSSEANNRSVPEEILPPPLW
jgi:hypothetical protein